METDAATQTRIAPPDVLNDLRALVDYNWGDEEKDYELEHGVEEGEEALEDAAGGHGHIFEILRRLDAWLETAPQRKFCSHSIEDWQLEVVKGTTQKSYRSWATEQRSDAWALTQACYEVDHCNE